jgi:4-hydroxy-tetrahydrodipicolinate synthase
MKINLKGMGVALITPFQSNGAVDYPALARLTDRLLQNGADYLVVLGTTGEPSTLSSGEQEAIFRFVVSQVDGRAPIIAGVGGNCTQTVVEKLASVDFSGFSAVLSVVPYYNKPSQEGIYRHYKCLSEVAPLPLILYNVPGRTGVNMAVETTLRLARECANIVAVKEASGNLEQIEQIVRFKPADFQVISGDDALAVESIAIGAEGLISVVGNAFPRSFKRVVERALAGDTSQALALSFPFAKLLELIFVEGNPAGIKSLLHRMGAIENIVRLPLVPVSSAVGEQIKLWISDVGDNLCLL